MNVMAHAVDRTMSGAVPLLPKDTAPSELRQTHLPEPTTLVFRRESGAAVEDALTPPRASTARDRSSDVSITKVSVPLPMQAAIIAMSLLIASQLWAVKSQLENLQAQIVARDRYEQRYQDQLEKNLELKIENAGLRTTMMDLTTAIANLRMQMGK